MGLINFIESAGKKLLGVSPAAAAPTAVSAPNVAQLNDNAGAIATSSPRSTYPHKT